MAKSYERYRQAKSNDACKVSGAVDFDEFPELSTFLGGVLAADGKSWELDPQTLTLWLEADMVHFCLGRREAVIKIFGSFQGLSEGLQGVEKALANGHCSERKTKFQR